MVVVVVQHGPPAVGYLLRVNAGRPTRTASASCRERNNHPLPHSGLLRATKPLFLLPTAVEVTEKLHMVREKCERESGEEISEVMAR